MPGSERARAGTVRGCVCLCMRYSLKYPTNSGSNAKFRTNDTNSNAVRYYRLLMSVVHAGLIVRPPRSRDESRELLRAYRCRGDTVARDRLVELQHAARPDARQALREPGRAARGPRADRLGWVLQAIERFDLDRGRDLVGYALPTIAGEIRHHLRDHAGVVRIPRRCIDSNGARSPVSLSTSEGTHARLGDAIATEAPYASSEDRLTLVAGLRLLTERERRIMHLRFFAGLSQDEIARQEGLSQVHVSRIIRASLERMRRALAVDGPAEARKPGSRVGA